MKISFNLCYPLDMKTIAQQIDAELQKRGMSRRKLAELAGIPPSTLQSALSRDTGLSSDMINTIAAVLGVPFYTLFYAEGTETAVLMQDLQDLSVDIAMLFSIIRGLIKADLIPAENVATVQAMLPDEAAIKERLERLIELARAVDSGDELLAGLNDLGKEEALKRIEELTMIPKYQQKPQEAAGAVLDRSKGKDT